MYFGGHIKDYKPNQYVQQQHIAHYDHLWAGYENDPNVNESSKRQYAEDLKKQIAEKRERDRLEKAALEAGQTFATKSINKNNINKSSYNSTVKESNYNKPEANMSKLSATSFSHTIPSPSSTLNATINFAETLRAQIDECRRSSYSALSHPIKPLILSQPLPSFSGSSSFDSSQLEIPNLSLTFRSNKSINGHQTQIRSVSMNGTSSLRSSLDQSSLQPPIINLQSPLDRSKVITPSVGFSTRNFKSKNTTFYQDTIPKPPSYLFSSSNANSTASNAQSHFNSKYQGFNVASLAHTIKPTYQPTIAKPNEPLMSETQMIYPDGYVSPH